MTERCLRLVTPEFVPQLRAIDEDCLGGFWSLAAYEKEVANPNSALVAVVQNDFLLGFGCFWQILTEAHITMVAVRSPWQGQGLGSAIVWGLLHQACQRDCLRATLEVRVSNQRAIALYRKFGFVELGQRKRYYHNPEEDGSIFWRSGLQDVGVVDDWRRLRPAGITTMF
ncbi:MAG: ribosomal protein S18-alanine N-acetyltransferase [Oscillatoriales cyanobacterium SM2_1_8]|nr:ribosomal protein S18-alanine N-acetyltransferase [Oscillatoriales cyanobacterium SM2_1_8]